MLMFNFADIFSLFGQLTSPEPKCDQTLNLVMYRSHVVGCFDQTADVTNSRQEEGSRKKIGGGGSEGLRESG